MRLNEKKTVNMCITGRNDSDLITHTHTESGRLLSIALVYRHSSRDQLTQWRKAVEEKVAPFLNKCEKCFTSAIGPIFESRVVQENP